MSQHEGDDNRHHSETYENEFGVHRCGHFLRVVPGFGDAEVSIAENEIEPDGYVSVVTWSSDYFLRVLRYGEGDDPDTLYINDFKTSILGNKAQDYQRSMSNLEFRKIDRIVYVDRSGAESVLWENPEA